jgi:F-type H+-transporting ATPase subunit delta
MSNLKIARPYAKAIFEIAKGRADLEKWSEMLHFAAEIANEETMVEAIKNPTLPKDQVINLFLELGQSLFTPEMRNLILVLGRFGRLDSLPDIADYYEDLRNKSEQIIPIEFISAVPVDAAYQSRLIQALKRKMSGEIELVCTTDKTLLGGAIIRSGDLYIDGSVRGKLAKLNDMIGIYR